MIIKINSCVLLVAWHVVSTTAFLGGSSITGQQQSIQSQNSLADRTSNYLQVILSENAPFSFAIKNSASNNLDETSTAKTAEKKSLEGCICVVTGASRGIGKGIALELGAQGATVYIAGTSTSSSKTDDSKGPSSLFDASTTGLGEPGTIEETAEQVTKAGGKGIPVYCNHANDDDVKALFDRVAAENDGQLDILVNNAFRLPPKGAPFLQLKFWEQGAEGWDSVHTVGLRSHYIASCYAMPLMFRSLEQQKRRLPRPLVIMIGSFGGLTYTFNVAYGVGKAGVDRLAKDMDVELQDEGKDIAVISLWPGLVDTERTQIAIQNGEWDEYVKIPILDNNSETPQFTGRAVTALATDPENKLKSGTYQVVAELADEYDFDDINGKRPPSIRSLRFLLPTYAFDENVRAKIPSDLVPNWKLPFWIMSQGRPPKDT